MIGRQRLKAVEDMSVEDVKAVDGRGRAWAGLLLTAAVTASYLYLEVSYNGTLVAVASDPTTPAGVSRSLSWVGKALAAFGLAWFLFGWAAKSLKGAAAFLLAWIVVFAAVAWGYDQAIASLPASVKDAGRVVHSHRASVAEGRASDGWLAPGGAVDPVAMASAPLALAVGGREAAMREASDSEAEGRLSDLEDGAARLRRAYLEVWSGLRTAHSDFLYWSMEYAMPPERRSMRAKAAFSKARYADGWTVDGRKIEIPQGADPDLAAFMAVTGGLTPDPNATPERFAREIAPKAATPEGERLRRDFLPKRVPMADGRKLALADMPADMTEAELDRWIERELIGPWEAKAGKDPEAWAATREAADVTASVFVPPISIALSQVSILLNAAKLLALLWAAWGLAETGRLRTLAATSVATAVVALAAYAAMPATAWEGNPEGTAVEQAARESLGAFGDAWVLSAALQRAFGDAGISSDLDVAREARRLWLWADGGGASE